MTDAQKSALESATSIDMPSTITCGDRVSLRPGPMAVKIGPKTTRAARLPICRNLSAAVKKDGRRQQIFGRGHARYQIAEIEQWANYDAYLPMNIERFCDFYI